MEEIINDIATSLGLTKYFVDGVPMSVQPSELGTNGDGPAVVN